MRIKEYAGIIAAAIYGVSVRLLFENQSFEIFEFSIFSLSFLWVLPIVMGFIPFLLARDELLASRWKQFMFPVASVFLFFTATLITGLEDLICILILSLPFTLVAGFAGLLVGSLLKRKNIDNGKLYSLILIPILLAPIESRFASQKSLYEVSSNIIINADQETIWPNIIEVPEITNNEYESGFFNYIGIPRPIKSVLKEIEGEEFRIGYFTDDLKLVEKIVEIDTLNHVAFSIDLQRSTLRDLPTDKHILQSGHFEFQRISYQLLPVNEERVNVKLSCSYAIDSKMNAYANFWAERIIKDLAIPR